MRQGRLLAFAAALLAVIAAAPLQAAPPAQKPAPARSTKSATHQFTGVVTALDKSSITVERTGRRAKAMVFAKPAMVTVTGDVQKNARVTVWYHDDDGHPVATRIVVRTAETAAR